MKTQALARLTAEANATYQDLVNYYQAITNSNALNPRYSTLQSDVEPLLVDLGMKFNPAIGKLSIPQWKCPPNPGQEGKIVQALETKGFKFHEMPLNPTLKFAMMSHLLMPKYGGMVTAVVKVWHTGVITVSIAF